MIFAPEPDVNMIRKLMRNINNVYKIAYKMLGLLIIMILFVLLLGILESFQHPFADLIRYILGNKEDLNLIIISFKIFSIIIFVSLGYFSMVFLFEVNFNKPKIKINLYNFLRKYIKIVSYIIILYIAISVLFEFLDHIILKNSSYVNGYVFVTILFLFKHAMVFVYVAIVIYNSHSTNNKFLLMFKIIFSKNILFLFMLLFIVTIIIVYIINKIIIGVLLIDTTMIPNYLNLLQFNKYGIWMTNACKIYEAIILPYIYLYFYLEYKKMNRKVIH